MTAFTDAQVKSLEAKLDSKHVRTRRVQDTTLAYVEGWHVIAEANRIFGYDEGPAHLIHALRLVWFSQPPLRCRLCRQSPHRSQGWGDRHHLGRLRQRECQGRNPWRGT